MSGLKICDHRDVILRPVVSERSYNLLDENKYTSIVAPHANKTGIKITIEKIFGVRVIAVNTQNRQGKRHRTHFSIGKRVDVKRAIVTATEGSRIDIFAGQGE